MTEQRMDAMTGSVTGGGDEAPRPVPSVLPLTDRVARIIDGLKPTPRELRNAELLGRLALTSFGEFAEATAIDAQALGERYDPDKVVYIGLIAATFRVNERRKAEEQLARQPSATSQHVMSSDAA